MTQCCAMCGSSGLSGSRSPTGVHFPWLWWPPDFRLWLHLTIGSVCVCFPRPTEPSEGKLFVCRCHMGQGRGNPRDFQTCLHLPQTVPPASVSLAQESGFHFPSPSFFRQAAWSLVINPRGLVGFPHSHPGHLCNSFPHTQCVLHLLVLSRLLCSEGPLQCL